MTGIRFDGRIASWNDERGFGFIAADQGGEEVFVHVKALVSRSGRPQAGQRVRFAVEVGPGGRKRATQVQILLAGLPRSRRSVRPEAPAAWSALARLALPLFAAVWVACAWVGHVPRWVAVLYGVASVVAFAAYGVDKAAARAGRWRTPESTLLGLGLLGGWPGALLAQQLLRHKSSKTAFRVAFWFTVVINVLAFVFVCSPWIRVA